MGDHNAGGGKFGFDLRNGAIEVDGAAGIAKDHGGKTEAAGVERGVTNAVVVRKAGDEDTSEVAFFQVTAQSRRGGPIVLEERGVGIDFAVEAFAKD